MATEKQKAAARENLKKARKVQSERAHGKNVPRQSQGISTAQENRLPQKEFAFQKQRKEPIHDAKHVRNAIARFDQVEGVSDADRDRAWARIKRAAKNFGVEVSENDWHELFEHGSAPKR